MSGIDLSAAVEAAARWNYERHYSGGFAWSDLDDRWIESARAIVAPIVTTAAPLIESAVRAQIAAEIEASTGDCTCASCDDYRVSAYDFARIARGES